jgi:hypothetical protein
MPRFRRLKYRLAGWAEIVRDEPNASLEEEVLPAAFGPVSGRPAAAHQAFVFGDFVQHWFAPRCAKQVRLERAEINRLDTNKTSLGDCR